MFQLVDRHRRLAAVRLVEEIGLAGSLEFTRTAGIWTLRLPVPDVDRMEYLLEIEEHHGRRSTITDPGNERRAPGAFGDKSVLEFAGYRPPEWLTAEPAEADTAAVQVDAPELGAPLEATLWTPSALAADEPAPLLVVHDGPEYASLAGLTQYLGASIASGALPPLRAALLDPGERNEWYSANPAYADALCEQMLKPLDDVAPATVRIGVGASLGALALLHAHRCHPAVFDAMLLQSGSFFTPVLDPQEAAFSGFSPVTTFVAHLHAATVDPHPLPAILTCGTVEENLGNNVKMTATLRRLGYPAGLVRLRDAHNYTAWRDALDPYLTDLVTDVVGTHAA